MIVDGPVEALGQTRGVGLAGGVAEQAEAAHLGGVASEHLLLETGVGDDEAAVLEPSVARQAFQKRARLVAKGLVLVRVLRHRAFQPVRHLHVVALEPAQELVVVVADDGKGMPARHHVHDDAQYVGRARPAVDKVADEKGATTIWRVRDGAAGCTFSFEAHRIAELRQERDKLVGAAVHVADDVEGPVDAPPVGLG